MSLPTNFFIGRGGGSSGSLPAATVLHLEDAGTNFIGGTWFCTTGQDIDWFGGAPYTGTDGDGHTYLNFAGSNTYGQRVLTLPSASCIISVIDERGSGPFIVEHSANANSSDGMYHYSNTGYTYGVRRSAFCGYDPDNAAGNPSADPVPSTGKTAFGHNLKTNNDTTGMFYSSDFGGKRDGSITSGNVLGSHNNVMDTLFIGARNGNSINFKGRLYELYITSARTDAEFNGIIAYYEDKYGL